MAAAQLISRHCPVCAVERWFEQPPCPDHAECPEWICCECGAALLTGWLAVDAPDRGAGERRVDSAA